MAVRDPRREVGQRLLDDIATAYLEHPGVDRGAMFGSQALRVLGKVFGFIGSEGALVVKVPGERASALIEDGTATCIRIGRNPAREWIGLPLAATDRWSGLLAESFRHVSQTAG